MLGKLGNIKLDINGTEVVLKLNGGLVKDVIFDNSMVFEDMFGWNVYSSLRYLFDYFQVDCIFRKKDGNWKKLNLDKVKELAYAPLKESV